MLTNYARRRKSSCWLVILKSYIGTTSVKKDCISPAVVGQQKRMVEFAVNAKKGLLFGVAKREDK